VLDKWRGNFKNKGLMREQREIVDNFFLSSRIGFEVLTKILAFSPNECQTNSFEKMNTLLSAILFILLMSYLLSKLGQKYNK